MSIRPTVFSLYLLITLVFTRYQPVLTQGTSGTPEIPQRIEVGRNVQVSKGKPNAWHFELWGGADLKDPNSLIACSNTVEIAKTQYGGKAWDRKTLRLIYYVSKDKGETWNP